MAFGMNPDEGYEEDTMRRLFGPDAGTSFEGTLGHVPGPVVPQTPRAWEHPEWLCPPGGTFGGEG